MRLRGNQHQQRRKGRSFCAFLFLCILLFRQLSLLSKFNAEDREQQILVNPDQHGHQEKQEVAKDNATIQMANKTSLAVTPQIAIFFNTFSAENKTQLAKDIIVSQLKEINTQPLLNGVPLFYSRIGSLDWDWPESECQGDDPVNPNSPSRVCTQITSTPTGDESLTLQPLFEYCTNHYNSTVVYLHSKGSFNPSEKQDQLRQVLMKAITSDKCLNMDNDAYHSLCDTCSTRTILFPFPSYTGNMWVAKCSYVSMLVPPNQFKFRKSEVIESIRNRTKKMSGRRGWFMTNLDNFTSYKFPERHSFWADRESWIGTGRYAAEHWVGSHPDLKPCEVFPSAAGFPSIQYGRRINVDAFRSPQLESVQETMNIDVATEFWNKSKGLVQHPLYGKDGKLYQYRYLYSKVPPQDSWFNTLWDQFQVPHSWGLKTRNDTNSRNG